VIFCVIASGLFILIVLWQFFYHLQRIIFRMNVKKIESRRNYDPVFGYHTNGGEPFILFSSKNKSTLFFMEGFRTQSPAGMYNEYFEYLFYKKKINVVVPVYGLQSSQFDLRNREWSFKEDIRSVVQIYDIYTATIHKDHSVITISQSFGGLPHSAILAGAKRRPDKAIFLSPFNSGIDFRVSGPVVKLLSRFTAVIKYIIPFTYAKPAKSRASVWDIVNRKNNLATYKRGDANPEDSADLGNRSNKAAVFMEKTIIPLIANYNIDIIWGDSDLYFAQSGFKSFADSLSQNNQVKTEILKNSGHMVLLDNEAEKLKVIIEKCCTNQKGDLQ